MGASNFKVIVIGGGPVGLTAAHALERAGIDFVLLERRPHVVIDAGANLVLLPVGMRALAQLDLMDQLNSVSTPLGKIDRLGHDGRDLGDSNIFNYIKEQTGMALRVISRHDLTKTLYDALPVEARSKLHGSKTLSNITSTASGVTVTCADGSSYHGSMVIGADGAHSMTRDIMRRLALDTTPEEVNVEQPFFTTYKCLWVRFPRTDNMPVGMTCETHGNNAATQLFIGEESGVIAVYIKLDKPTKDRIRFSQADQDALVERWGHLPVTPGNSGMTLRDVYNTRLEAGLVSLEEGVVAHWGWNGRVVLAGDAAHKFTPSTGAGCNNGMIDIVALVNELHALQSSSPSTPTSSELQAAFQAYQNIRYDEIVSECTGSGKATTTATWQTFVHQFIDRYVMSWQVVQKFIISQGTKKLATTPSFNFAIPKRTLVQVY